MDPTEAKVRQILIDDYAVDGEQLQASQSLSGDLELDSIELIEFAMELEEAFDVEIDDSAVTASMTVGQVCDSIRKLKG